MIESKTGKIPKSLLGEGGPCFFGLEFNAGEIPKFHIWGGSSFFILISKLMKSQRLIFFGEVAFDIHFDGGMFFVADSESKTEVPYFLGRGCFVDLIPNFYAIQSCFAEH